MDIKTIGVIGAGTMGSGISHVMALSGFEVVMMDIKNEFVHRGIENIKKGLDKMLEKGKIIPEKKERALARILTTTKLEDMAKVDFVIEAASEIEELKLDIFKRLDKICSHGVILCSNTSSISITRIASATKRPDKVIGMHFMNPAPVMKLVEIIRGMNTSDETFATVKSLTEKIGKVTVESRDHPGFIVNRILMPMINEAIYSLYEGVAGVEEIDSIMKLGMAHPMGPLQLADYIGLDVCLSILNVLHEGFGNPKYAPCPLLVNMVNAGHLGIKSEKGFYKYKPESKELIVADRFKK